MLKLSERGTIHILLLIILLAGLAAGLFLIKNPQIFKPKAYYSPETVLTDATGTPLPTKIENPNVYILLKLPKDWQVSPSEGPLTNFSIVKEAYAQYSAGGTLSEIIIENMADNDNSGLGGSAPLSITSGFKNYVNKPVPWKLTDLNPHQNEAWKTVRVKYFSEDRLEYSSTATVILSRQVLQSTDEIPIEVIIDSDFSDAEAVSKWAQDSIDSFLNEKLAAYDIKRKVRYQSYTTEQAGGCFRDFKPPAEVPVDNKIRLYITKDTGSTGLAYFYSRIICIGVASSPLSSADQNVLLHELGHVFGLPDYYLLDIWAGNNEVVPISINSSVHDVMWYTDPYFDPNSREIINRSPNPLPGTIWNWQYYTPKQVILQILADNGIPLPNVKVEVFPMIMKYLDGQRYPTRFIPNVASLEKVTDNTGRVFLGNQEAIFRHSKIYSSNSGGTALVRVTQDADVGYTALTLSYLNTIYFAQGQTNFATIILPFSQLEKAPEPGRVKIMQALSDEPLTEVPILSDQERGQLDRHVYEQLKASGEIKELPQPEKIDN